MAAKFDDFTREILDGKNFATLATLNEDGSPHTSVVWFEREGDHLLITITDRRKKARNLARDPRVSLSVLDLENPYRTVDIRGTAELIEDPERALSYRLTHRYLGIDPPQDPPGSRRLIVRITPERVHRFAA
ncbi:MAG TPA: PPOX class F420-dependent oxidoreductase [Thermomicrobiales bacterium]|nr:PPOX class F420-dependent oxidoreductase [Thermomicrobiales bacterium]